MPTQLARTRSELAALRSRAQGDVAVVMTMGALHEGHATLVREARRRARTVLVTVFLNPLQFGPLEDLSRYPQTLAADLEICRREGVDIVFAPGRDEVYPGGDPVVRIDAGPLGDVLEGASRPGHFDGVLTVVAKLMHLTAPQLAYFGQKDAQQLLLIRRMAADLDLPVEVVAVPTVRDADGLALSSRNTYLDRAGRRSALALSRALRAGAAVQADGGDAVLAAAGAVLDLEPGVHPDYLELADPWTLGEPDADGDALLLVAARVGSTRLIDNERVRLGRPLPVEAPGGRLVG